MADVRITSKTHRMSHVVIVGAGPNGLFTALRLKQKGVKNVTVVDAGAGEYTRKGDFSPHVFTELEKMLDDLPIVPSHARHIHNLEDQLFAQAQTKGVTILKANCKDVDDEYMVIVDSTGKETKIRCDIPIDCSATKRVLINKINEMRPGTFSILPAGDNPNKSYLMVRGTMCELQSTLFNHFDPKDFSDKDFEEKMKDFHRLNWKELAPPHIYANTFNNNKVHFYSHAPDDLKNPDDQLKWLQTTFELKLGRTDTSFEPIHDSKKHPQHRKPKMSHFHCKPHLTTPAYYLEDEKTEKKSAEKKGPNPPRLVFHAGDATADLPFKTGKGLVQGAQRANALVNAMHVVDGEIIEINLSQYTREFDAKMLKHKEILDKHYAGIQERFDNGRRVYLEYCRKSLATVADEKTGIALNKLDALKIFKECIHYLFKIMESPTIQAAELKSTQEILLEVVNRCKQLANHFLSIKNFPLAVKYYKISLDIYSKYFPNQYANEVIAVYYNAIIAAKKRNDFDEVLSLTKTGRKTVLPHVTIDTEKFTANIIINEASAHIKKANLLLSGKRQQVKSATVRIEAAKNLINTIITNPFCKVEYLGILAKQIAGLEIRINNHLADNQTATLGCS